LLAGSNKYQEIQGELVFLNVNVSL
jgi:hypothetical protein